MNFSSLPAADRWTVLDRELPRIIASHITAAAVDPSDEVSVLDLATKHGVGERSMVNRLPELGGAPYQLGKAWFIPSSSPWKPPSPARSAHPVRPMLSLLITFIGGMATAPRLVHARRIEAPG